MATVQTYGSSNSIREDLADIIYNISPTRTPFMSNAGRGKCDQTFTEWQTDSLDAADDTNARVEGADASDTAHSDTNRVGNYTQISDKVINVSGTANSVDRAGMKTVEAYLTAKRGKEIKRDMEKILLKNQAAVAGNSSTARKLAGLPAWIRTNTVTNGDVEPTMSSTNDGYPNAAWTAAGTPVAPVPFTEAMLKDAISQLWSSGGECKMLMVGPYNKTVVSGFAGIAEHRVQVGKAAPTMIVGAADVYVSDFGNLSIVPNLFTDESFAHLLDPEYVSVDYLRPFKTEALAKTGDSKRKQLIVEYTLRVKQEKALATVANLTTSA
jgi:hypothetical protein